MSNGLIGLDFGGSKSAELINGRVMKLLKLGQVEQVKI